MGSSCSSSKCVSDVELMRHRFPAGSLRHIRVTTSTPPEATEWLSRDLYDETALLCSGYRALYDGPNKYEHDDTAGGWEAADPYPLPAFKNSVDAVWYLFGRRFNGETVLVAFAHVLFSRKDVDQRRVWIERLCGPGYASHLHALITDWARSERWINRISLIALDTHAANTYKRWGYVADSHAVDGQMSLWLHRPTSVQILPA